MYHIVLLTMCYTIVSANPVTNYRVVTVDRPSNINKDLQEFLNLLPADKISAVVKDYTENDEEVKNLWTFVQSSIFAQQIELIQNSEEFQNILQHLQNIGVDIPNFMVQIHQITTRPPSSSPVQRGEPGLHGLLLGSIKPMIPISQIKLLATQKFIFSSEFRKMIRLVTSRKFKSDVQALIISKPVKDLEKGAKMAGIQVEAVYEFVASFKFLYDYLLDL